MDENIMGWMKTLHIFTCITVLVLTSYNCLAQNYEEIIISPGTLKGLKKDGVTRYLGVPYAEAPVGSLRFKAPFPHKGWSGVRDASVKAPTCPQNISFMEFLDPDRYKIMYEPLMDNMSEDCLTLDVYVPEGLPERSPVLFSIHGGCFFWGDGSYNGLTDGDILAKETSSIVINLQYRLGAFGFLPINHPDYPANLGILDQILALQWVQENAHYFNGDKDSVTIFGESAGGMSVFAHMQSPLSKGLFHRAIPQSAFPYTTMLSVAEGEALTTKLVAAEAGCPAENQAEMISCLEGLSADDLQQASTVMASITVPADMYLDNNIFLQHPIDTYKKGLFNKVPLLVTLMSDDGNVIVEMFQDQGKAVLHKGLTPNTLDTIISTVLTMYARVPHNEIEFYTTLIKHEYDLNNPDPAKQLRNAYHFARDSFFSGMTLFVAEAYSKAGVPVYVAVFDEPMRQNKGLIEVRAAHLDDLFYIYGMIHREEFKEWKENPEASEELLKALTKNIMNIFHDLCRGNDLSIKWKDEEIRWPKFDLDDKKYFLLNVDMSKDSVRSNLSESGVKFWSNLLPSLLETGSACSGGIKSTNEDDSKLHEEKIEL